MTLIPQGGGLSRRRAQICSGCAVETGLEGSSRWRATGWAARLQVAVGETEKNGWVCEKNTKSQKAYRKSSEK